MKIENVKVSELIPYERNAKKHDATQIKNVAESIKQFGFAQPIVVDKNNVVIIGHCRLLASKRLKLKEVPVVRMENLTDEQVQKLRLLDNRLNESEWDFDLLAEDIPQLDFSDFEIDWGLPEEQEENTEIEEDEAPEPPTEPKAKLGDLYILGNHRLICGDSTDPAVIDRLMDGVKADMVFTDPPYGVNVKGGKGKGNLIMGDLTQTAIPFSFEIAVKNCTKEKAHFYFCGGESNIQLYQKLFDRYLHMLPKHLIWVKNGFVMKQNGYHNQFEIIFHGYKEGSGAIWYGGRTENEASDVWHVKRDASTSYVHPTQKPIELPMRAIKNSCPPSGSVVDLFGGSGSTLIACEQLNRKCYMCELDPHYIDVIVQRYINFKGTDEDVFLIRDGQRIPYKDVI